MVDLDDVAHCPRGVRCESCGAERGNLSVRTVRLSTLGVACLTLCSPCATSGVVPPVTVSTAARLTAQHAMHLGIDLDQMAAALSDDEA